VATVSYLRIDRQRLQFPARSRTRTYGAPLLIVIP
jgi:hypothetical protein